MTLAEQWKDKFEQLPEDEQREVLDFMEFLEMKRQRELDALMDEVIVDNLPAFRELAK